MRANRKITDYFPLRKPITPTHNSSQIIRELDIQAPVTNSISQCTRSPGSPECVKSCRGNDESL